MASVPALAGDWRVSMKEKKLTGWYSWPAVICLLIFCWPVGLFLLIRRISLSNTPTEKIAKGLFYAGCFCLLGGVVGVMMCFIDYFPPEQSQPLLLYFVFSAGFFAAAIPLKRDAENTQKYKAVILTGNVCRLDQIAEAVGKPVETVTKDIRRLIRKGRLPNAYINEATREVVLPRERSVSATEKCYADPVSAKRSPRVVTCPCCGGKNTLGQGVVECEYCGSPIE